jgi:thymidylate synthase (FAD)
MKVELVSCTRPVGKLEGSEVRDVKDLVAYCARVSNPNNQMNSQTADKLIKYLKKHRHWSPFEMADVTLEIETTRDIARQMLRHRSFSFQEFSQRYSDVSELGEMFESSEARLQDEKNRQNSVEVVDDVLQKWWEERQKEVIDASVAAYRAALDRGIAKEVARKVLPEGLTKSRLFMKGSIRSWIHYLEVRGPGSGTQKEHMLVAEQVAKAIAHVFSLPEEGAT